MSLCFITERTLNNLSTAMRIKYDEFINEGSLIIHNGTILDMDEVYLDVFNYIEEKNLDVRSFGFDPYNADKFVERWRQDHGPFGLDVVKQGVRTETVPLGELKMLAEDNHLLHTQSIVTFCMGNSVVIRDNNGGRKLMKLSYDKKIDVVSAMMDAFVSYKLNKEVFE
jgi:phage terminase large subunit-like protein